MAYDESIYRRRDTESGVRDETDYRTPPKDYRDTDGAETTLNGQRRVNPAVLDDVFDDPEHGEPGRDRMAVHAVWEVILLLGAAALTFLLYRENSDALRGDARDDLLVSAAALGLLALGAGLTLRAGAVNLAIGPVAVLAGLHFAENGDRGVLTAAGVAVIAGALAGVVLAVFTVGLHVPGWATGLAAALAVIVAIQQRDGAVDLQGEYDPNDHALYLFGGVAALAIVGGLLGSIKSVRRAIGRYRPVSDPARRRGGLAAALTGGAIVLSTVFAVVGGVLLAANDGQAVAPEPGLELTGLAVGAALLGGTSAYGRRGGVFGTLLAVVAITVFIRYSQENDWRISDLAIAAAVIAGGLVVTRLVEELGRPRVARPVDTEEWDNNSPATESTTPVWSSSPRQESWSSALPAQPAGGRSDPWENDRWGTPGR